MVKNLDELCRVLDISIDDLKGVKVLLLPENIDSAESSSGLQDAGGTMMLGKHLKSQGVPCKSAFDFGLKPKIADRRGLEVWLGVLWILEKVAAPVIVACVVAYLLKNKKQPNDNIVHIDLRLQDGERVARLKFDGTVDSLLLFTSAIERPREQSVE